MIIALPQPLVNVFLCFFLCFFMYFFLYFWEYKKVIHMWKTLWKKLSTCGKLSKRVAAVISDPPKIPIKMRGVGSPADRFRLLCEKVALTVVANLRDEQFSVACREIWENALNWFVCEHISLPLFSGCGDGRGASAKWTSYSFGHYCGIADCFHLCVSHCKILLSSL